MEDFMNKIDLLKARREEILQAGSEIRKQIQKLTDEESFVEFDSYSFSKNDFYDGVGGEGVNTLLRFRKIIGTQQRFRLVGISMLLGGNVCRHCVAAGKAR